MEVLIQWELNKLLVYIYMADHLGKKKKRNLQGKKREETLWDYVNFYIISKENHILGLIKWDYMRKSKVLKREYEEAKENNNNNNFNFTFQIKFIF